MIPYGRQDIQPEDIAAVEAVLRSDFLTQGQTVDSFEHALVQACGAQYAIAVNSATAALHVAYKALGLGKEDILWTSPITFAATSNAALMCQASVEFVDVDADTALMCLNRLEDALKRAELSGKLPKIVVPVQFAGQCVPMSELSGLADRFGFRIVEDASHAIGGFSHGIATGACQYSDICVFSFHPVKIITTAEGGAALTNDAALAEKMQDLRSHGIHRRQYQMLHAQQQGGWYYEMNDLGANYRLPDVLAALGNSQIKRLSDYVQRRHVLAQRYDQALCAFPVRPLHQIQDQYSACHLYVIQLDQAHKRQSLYDSLRDRGVGVQVHYIPVPYLPYYRQLGFDPDHYPQAMTYYQSCLSLPLFPRLSEQEQDSVINHLCDLCV